MQCIKNLIPIYIFVPRNNNGNCPEKQNIFKYNTKKKEEEKAV